MRHEKREYLVLEARPLHHDLDAAGVESDFEKTLRRRGWTRTGGRAARTGGQVRMRFATYEGRTSKGDAIGILAAFLSARRHRWILTMVADRGSFEEKLPGYEEEARGIAFLDDAQVAALGAPRLVVRMTGDGETWESLARTWLGDAAAAERLAFYNGEEPGAPPVSGWPLKIPPSLATHP